MFLVSCSLERSEPTASIPKDSVIADLHKSTSSYVSSDSACTVVANKSGGFDMYCGGYFVGNLYDALDSSSSKNDGACIIEEIAKSDGYDVYCGGVKQGELHNGKDGVSCNAFQDNVTEEISVSCGDTLIGILHNGKDGEKGEKGEKGEMGAGCELRDNAKGDGYDVYCGDTKQGELHNGKTGVTGKQGEQGKTGESCSAESSNNGDVKITCGKNTVTLQKGENGKNGESCTIEPASSSGYSGYNIKCGNVTKFIHDGKDGRDGAGCYVKPVSSSGSIIGYDIFCGSSSSVGRITNGKDGATGQDGESCTMEEISSSSGYYNITCGNDTYTIHNGSDGKKGDKGDNCTIEPASSSGYSGYNIKCGSETKFIHDGKDGKDGAGCYVKPVSSSSSIIGYDIFCGSSSSVGRITNGAEGAKGQDGKSCTMEEISSSSGYYNITCGNDTYTIHNGSDGKKGEKGDNCTIEPASSSGSSGYNIKCGDVTQFVHDGKDGKDGVGCSLIDNIAFVKIMCGKDTAYINKNSAKYCIGKNGNYTEYDEKTQLCDTRDGQVYSIDTFTSSNNKSYVWMTQDLNYNEAFDNDIEDLQIGGLRTYCHDNKEKDCKTWGRLYTIAAAHDSLGTASGEATYCGTLHHDYDCGNPLYDDKGILLSYDYSKCNEEDVKEAQEYDKCNDYANKNYLLRGVCPSGWHLPTADDFPTNDDSFNNSLNYGNVRIICKKTDGTYNASYNKFVVTTAENYAIRLWGIVGDNNLILSYKEITGNYGSRKDTYSNDRDYSSLEVSSSSTDPSCFVDAAPVRCVKDYSLSN